MITEKPELIAPSGDWSSLLSAVKAGADSVYFGVKDINMRQSARNFDILEIKKIMDILHDSGKKGYLALNTIVYDNELGKVRKILEEAKKRKVDAVVLWDMAVLSIARELGLEIHLSTQASVANFEALKFFADQGVKRVVLARECGLCAIRNITGRIRKEKIDCEIETFIHGALCVSISGRCFLSQHSFSKSANRGECYQPCRRGFVIKSEGAEEDCEYILGHNYILSPKDLCTIGFIEELIRSGIRAFKIEGRMRPPEYVSRVTSVYRTAIDAFFRGELTADLKKQLSRKLEMSFNRGFEEGFYFEKPGELGGIVSRGYEKVYLGEIKRFYKRIGVAEVELTCGSLTTGQKILITGKKTPAAFSEVSEMEIDHKSVVSAGKGTSAGIKLPFAVSPGDKVFLWKEEK
ncbi:MAG: peptidase U32 family protein [Candidatus Omnitrophota bacterium]